MFATWPILVGIGLGVFRLRRNFFGFGDCFKRKQRLAPFIRPGSGAKLLNHSIQHGTAFLSLSRAKKEFALQFLERRHDESLAV